MKKPKIRADSLFKASMVMLLMTNCSVANAQIQTSTAIDVFSKPPEPIQLRSDYSLHDLIVPSLDTIINTKKWHYRIEPYLMFASMKGTLGLDSLPTANVDAPVGDLLGHLKFMAALYFEMHNNKWVISSDFFYVKLGEEVEKRTIINSGEATVQQVFWEVAGMRRVLPLLDIGIGFRINDIQSQLDLTYRNPGSGLQQKSWRLSQTWVDPFVVAQTKIPFLNGLLFAQARGDIGGFGIGSVLAWEMQVYAGINISKSIQASLGYRVISTDYKHGSGRDYFLYDVNMFGPVLRFGLNL